MSKKKRIISIMIGVLFIGIILTFYSTFSLEENYLFQTDVYEIAENSILGISPNTSISLFYHYFDLENCSIKVVDESNHEITTGYIPNNSKTLLYNQNNKVITSYTNIIKGDINKDGLVNEIDLQQYGKYLIEKTMELPIKSLDINEDLEIHLNDLILLDKTLNNDYQNLEINKDSLVLQSEETQRVVGTVTPNYGKNTNLIWKSQDTTIATVDESGKITGHQEGETIITAQTMDQKLTQEVKVTVDNTIRLAKKEGIAYIGGNNLEVEIEVVEEEGLTCTSSKENIASCQIQDKKLILTPLGQGNTTITIQSPKYKEALFYLDVMSVYLNVMPKYFCTTKGNVELITISAMNSGPYRFDISNKNIIHQAEMMLYQGRNMLKISMGQTAGRATLTVTEGHGNKSNEVTIDVYHIAIPAIGALGTIGTDMTTAIKGENLGRLVCTSSDEAKATCDIDGTNLIVHPHAKGDVTISVTNKLTFREEEYDCGKAEFLAVIREG